MTADRYTFLGFPVTDAVAARMPDRMVLFDNHTGRHVMRHRTAEYVGVPRKPKGATA